VQTHGSELCLAIVGPSRVRNLLSERMRDTALCHTEMVRDPVVLQVVVTSTAESVLGRLPNETFRVQVMGELVAKFWRLEELC
jgi:hypothetical protein